MANITASMVKEMRELSGCGMMDCKNVLVEADGDMEKAAELRREKGLAKAVKKSGRIAAEGMAQAYVTDDAKEEMCIRDRRETLRKEVLIMERHIFEEHRNIIIC